MKLDRRDFLKGLGGTLPLLAMQMSPARSAVQALPVVPQANTTGKPNILILVFDTLSALHTSLHDYGRETTPNLTRFAQVANVYHNHYAAGNYTTPGTASLLTGTYAWTNRAFNLFGTVLDELGPQNLFAAVDDSYYQVAYTHNPYVSNLLFQFQQDIDHWKQTRSLCLRNAEYSDLLFPNDYGAALDAEIHTLGLVNRPRTSLALSLAGHALAKLSERSINREYETLFPRGVPGDLRNKYKLEDVVDWLLADITTLPRPFLAYVHVYPPHAPYRARSDFVDIYANDGLATIEKPLYFSSDGMGQVELDESRRLYDEYLAYTDSEFGRLYDGLRKSELFDNTLVMVTSDHGELHERGISGHLTPALYQALLRVPLLIKRPRQSERQDIQAPTSCIDILPSLLSETGQPAPEWCEGKTLPGFGGAREDPERAVFAVEAKSNPKMAPLNTSTIAIVKGDYKLIQNSGYGAGVPQYELYNLAADPEELDNRYSLETAVAKDLREELVSMIAEKDAAYGKAAG